MELNSSINRKAALRLLFQYLSQSVSTGVFDPNRLNLVITKQILSVFSVEEP